MTRTTVRAGWNTLIALLATALTMLVLSHVSRAAEISWQTNWNAARTESQATGKPLMVDFYTDWCGWCKKLDTDVYPDAQVVSLSSRFVMLKLNAEREGAPQAAAYKVHSYPSIYFFNPNGSVLQYLSGYAPAPQFAEMMRKAIGGSVPVTSGGTVAPDITQFTPSTLSPQARAQIAAMRRAAHDKNYSRTYVLDEGGSAILLDETGSYPVKPKAVTPKAKKAQKVAMKPSKALPAKASPKKAAVKMVSVPKKAVAKADAGY